MCVRVSVLKDVLRCMGTMPKLDLLRDAAASNPAFAFQVIDATLWDIGTLLENVMFEVAVDNFPAKCRNHALAQLRGRCTRLLNVDASLASAMPHLVWVRGCIQDIGSLDAPRLREASLVYHHHKEQYMVAIQPSIQCIEGVPQVLSRVQNWDNIRVLRIKHSTLLELDLAARRQVALLLRVQRPALKALICEDPVTTAMLDLSAFTGLCDLTLTTREVPDAPLRATGTVSVRLADGTIFGATVDRRPLCISQATTIYLRNVRNLAPLPPECGLVKVMGRLAPIMEVLKMSRATSMVLLLTDRDDVIRIPGCLPATLQTLVIDFVGLASPVFEDPQNWLLPRVLTSTIVEAIKRCAPLLESVLCGKKLYSHRIADDPLIKQVFSAGSQGFANNP